MALTKVAMGIVAAAVMRAPQIVAMVSPCTVARVQDQVLHIGADVMATILKRAADRGEARRPVSPMVATLPTDLYRHQIFLTRTPPTEAVITQIVDDVFLPLVQP